MKKRTIVKGIILAGMTYCTYDFLAAAYNDWMDRLERQRQLDRQQRVIESVVKTMRDTMNSPAFTAMMAAARDGGYTRMREFLPDVAELCDEGECGVCDMYRGVAARKDQEVKVVDPELEALLQEEERIERDFRASQKRTDEG